MATAVRAMQRVIKIFFITYNYQFSIFSFQLNLVDHAFDFFDVVNLADCFQQFVQFFAVLDVYLHRSFEDAVVAADVDLAHVDMELGSDGLQYLDEHAELVYPLELDGLHE